MKLLILSLTALTLSVACSTPEEKFKDRQAEAREEYQEELKEAQEEYREEMVEEQKEKAEELIDDSDEVKVDEDAGKIQVEN